MKTDTESRKAGIGGFFDHGEGETKSNAIEIPKIEAPKAGGAIKGIDEKLAVNKQNGSVELSIPIPFPEARALTPGLSINYNSGQGNGIFGTGWSLNLGSIKRKTEGELPKYIDEQEPDTFQLSGVEDLVPVLQKNEDGYFLQDSEGNYNVHEQESSDQQNIIRLYIPRTEGAFNRIERWTEKQTGTVKWRVLSRDNVTTLYGWTQQARLYSPNDENKIYQWFPELTFDDKGNCIQYEYKRENGEGVNRQLHLKNKVIKGLLQYTNLYPSTIYYGNKKPYTSFNQPFLNTTDYLFKTVFDYGEYQKEAPFENTLTWGHRADAFSNYRAGFEIRTSRLCQRVLQFHQFEELPGKLALVKALEFDYSHQTTSDLSLLTSVTTKGYFKKEDGSYAEKAMPPLEFDYEKVHWNTQVKTISKDNLEHIPSGFADEKTLFVDLYNEGLSGILHKEDNAWTYKYNLGHGIFSAPELVMEHSNLTVANKQWQLLDLEANGQKQLVNYGDNQAGFYEIDKDKTLQGYQPFSIAPFSELANGQGRMIDLTGDGKADLLISETNALTWYQSNGKTGFLPKKEVIKLLNEEGGINTLYANAKEKIFLADMTGDGLTDLVRISNGHVAYWPNMGHGKFGALVTMDHAPLFDQTDAFDVSKLQLADVDGSGTADIIYLGTDKVSCWKNLSGNTFGLNVMEVEADVMDNHSHIQVLDFLGTGMACLVWSSNLPSHEEAPLKYIDLLDSKKPHMLATYKNNMGKEIRLSYKPSTYYYLEDKKLGNDWVSKLHFPIHCLSQTTVIDHITGHRYVQTFKYHHGYYDNLEKEFRGFGMVEQLDTEAFEHWEVSGATNLVDKTIHQDPVVTKIWNHTGMYVDKTKTLNQYAKDYWFNHLKKEGYEVDENEHALEDVCFHVNDSILYNIEEWSTSELVEAHRACKGVELRSEVFAQDLKEEVSPGQLLKEKMPFSVVSSSYEVELIQPKGQNKHAVFLIKEAERLVYTYDRQMDDPRTSHKINIVYDELGHVLASASVVYPRSKTDTSLPQEIQEEQQQTAIIYTQQTFTNDVIAPDVYRLRQPSEQITYELKEVSKAGDYYTKTDFREVLNRAIEVDYSVLTASFESKRVIEHIKTIYYDDEAANSLPLHQLTSKALSFENYQKAFTTPLLNAIYGDKVDHHLLAQGGYVELDNDGNWWVPSGTLMLRQEGEAVSAVEERFYLPVAAKDQNGNITQLFYDEQYHLFVQKVEDSLGNTTTIEAFDYNHLSPLLIKDQNDNLSATVYDELGIVKATALMGKGDEADNLHQLLAYATTEEIQTTEAFFNATNDEELTSAARSLLKEATTRFVYDVFTYQEKEQPVGVAAIQRVVHASNTSEVDVQIKIQYGDGSGQNLVTKVQAPPGECKKVTVSEATVVIEDVDTNSSPEPQNRWLAEGKEIKNNKGKVVKKYEPYYASTFRLENYQELVEIGVASIHYYDAFGRHTQTALPNGTYTKSEQTPWLIKEYDVNDTLLDSPWYISRNQRTIDSELIAEGKDPEQEERAASLAGYHYETPVTNHLSPLAKPILQIQQNKNELTGTEQTLHTIATRDVEGNLLAIKDSRGNTVVTYQYDMLGKTVFQHSMDAGKRWKLNTVFQETLSTWDERHHQVLHTYDGLNRPVSKKVMEGDGPAPLNHTFEKIVYGDGLADAIANNQKGKPVLIYDQSGVTSYENYDFKGLPGNSNRRFHRNYKTVIDWEDPSSETGLEEEVFVSTMQYDALGRIIQQTYPDNSIYEPQFSIDNKLQKLFVTHKDQQQAFVEEITYNAKGQRTQITYGNGIQTNYKYDRETFRLIQLKSINGNGSLLQDLNYTYDPVGNIIAINDKAIPEVFFNNQKTEGISLFTYDSFNQLIEATGREHAAQAAYGLHDNWADNPFLKQFASGDAFAFQPYTQQYTYDNAGNLLKLRHQAAVGGYVRDYAYATDNNRLLNTTINGQQYTYDYHPEHGYITSLPHLSVMEWDFMEHLKATSKQVINSGTPETTFYVYDYSGKRVRKITENASSSGAATKKQERYYLGATELFRTYDNSGNLSLERETLHIMDDKNRVALIETRTQGTDDSPPVLVRYQLANHLGSSQIEANEQGQVISYEEYHPFGTTSYQAKDKPLKARAKRYRYTGMERDEESGLNYHNARYYVPWLGRWLSPDPIGMKAGLNFYTYCKNNPIIKKDRSGTEDFDFNRDSTFYKEHIDEFKTISTHETAQGPITILEHPEHGRFYLGEMSFSFEGEDELEEQIEEGVDGDYTVEIGPISMDYWYTEAEALALIEAGVPDNAQQNSGGGGGGSTIDPGSMASDIGATGDVFGALGAILNAIYVKQLDKVVQGVNFWKNFIQAQPYVVAFNNPNQYKIPSYQKIVSGTNMAATFFSGVSTVATGMMAADAFSKGHHDIGSALAMSSVLQGIGTTIMGKGALLQYVNIPAAKVMSDKLLTLGGRIFGAGYGAGLIAQGAYHFIGGNNKPGFDKDDAVAIGNILAGGAMLFGAAISSPGWLLGGAIAAGVVGLVSLFW